MYLKITNKVLKIRWRYFLSCFSLVSYIYQIYNVPLSCEIVGFLQRQLVCPKDMAIWQFSADQSACHRTLELTNKLLWENMTGVAHFAVKAFRIQKQNCLPQPGLQNYKCWLLCMLISWRAGCGLNVGGLRKNGRDDKSSPYKLCCHLSHLMVFAFVYPKVSASSTRILYVATLLNHPTVFHFLFLCQYLRGDLSGFLILSDLCRFWNPILKKLLSPELRKVGV